MDAISRAVELLGGPSAAAKTLGVSPQAVAQWTGEKRPVPLERCIAIEKATDRQITCEQLRPDKISFWKSMSARQLRRVS